MKSTTFCRIVFFCFCKCFFPFCGIAQTVSLYANNDKTYSFINGEWFDGNTFQLKTFYTERGLLTSKAPTRVDSVVDLKGKFVVPPFGEAHNHNVEWYGADRFYKLRDKYLRDGIFYVKNPNDVPRFVLPLLDKINNPGSIDVVFANGSFTASGGHPMEIAKRNIDRKLWTEQDGEGGFYYTIDTPRDFDVKWTALKKTKPDFVKTYLLYSEEFEKRKNDTSFFGWKGLDPSILKIIVSKVHKDGYRVSAHVETAADFHNALLAGVDEINHMPGFRAIANYGFQKYAIAEPDARLAAKNRTVVVTTMGGAIDYVLGAMDTVASAVSQKEMIIHNLSILQKNKVLLAIGTDIYGQDTRYEIQNLRRLNIFDNVALLKMWCETTAQTIFPKRKIGFLKDGYEANFLVLDGDPLIDFENTGKIILRVKSGFILSGY